MLDDILKFYLRDDHGRKRKIISKSIVIEIYTLAIGCENTENKVKLHTCRAPRVC